MIATSAGPTIRSLIVTAAVAVLAAGCGSSYHTSSPPVTTATSPSTAAAAPPTSPAPGAGATTITATLTEFHIALSRQALPAGTYTVSVTNAGTTLHALDITGSRGPVAASGSLLPGQSKSMKVTLGPGSYQLYCPVDGHRELGMDTTITVTGSAPATPATTAPSGGGGY